MNELKIKFNPLYLLIVIFTVLLPISLFVETNYQTTLLTYTDEVLTILSAIYIVYTSFKKKNRLIVPHKADEIKNSFENGTSILSIFFLVSFVAIFLIAMKGINTFESAKISSKIGSLFVTTCEKTLPSNVKKHIITNVIKSARSIPLIFFLKEV